MKVTIEVDCTPQEARQFLGLPDVEPIQRVMMKEMEERAKQNMSMMDPETFVKTWMPIGEQGVEHIQRMMAGLMTGGKPGGSKPSGSKE